MVSLSVSKGRQKHNVSCLLDTGSQRSYFSKGVAEKLKCKKHSFTPGDYEASTFLGTRKKRLEEVVLGIQVDKDRTLHLTVIVDEDFDINLNIDHFGEVKENLNNLKHKLAFTDNGSDQVRVHGLIGVDIIHEDNQMHEWNSLRISYRHRPPPWVTVIPGTDCPGESWEERSGEQLPDYHYRLLLLSQGACKFCFKSQNNLSGCIFRMFRWKKSRCKICEKKKSNSNYRKSTEEYNYLFWTIIIHHHSHGFLLRRECVEIFKELVILFHRISAAPWCHVASTIKRATTGDSPSFCHSHRCLQLTTTNRECVSWRWRENKWN